MITVIASLKGGSGKSTLTFNLGVLMSAKQDVLIVDLDPQATLLDVAEIRFEDEYEPQLNVIGEDQTFDAKKLRTLDKKHDQILIDCAAGAPEAVRVALGVADRIIVPIPPSQADVWSAQKFLDIVIDSVGSAQKKKQEILVFVNRADTHRGVRESIETEAALRMLKGVRVIRSSLGQRTTFRRSFSEGMAVFELEPRGKAAAEFAELARKLFRRR